MNPYRIAGLPGDGSPHPDAFLDQSEIAVAEQWRELADTRKRLRALVDQIAMVPSAPDAPATLAAICSQIAVIDSAQNGLALVRAFQRLNSGLPRR